MPARAPSATARRYAVKIHWPYVLTEAFFVVYQLAWMVLLAVSGLVWCSVGAAYLAGCVLYVAYFYGDHAGRVAFIFDVRHTLDENALMLSSSAHHRSTGR